MEKNVKFANVMANNIIQGGDILLTEERALAILKILDEQKTVTVQQLTSLLDASESTIRRDLSMLHKQGKLIKVHGGATIIDFQFVTTEDKTSDKQSRNIDEKIAIAKYAASLLKENDFVFLDAGTTTEKIIDYLPNVNATFVTNSISHAKKIALKGVHTIILGGELKLTTEAIVGIEAMNMLKKYNFSKGFFGTNGIHINNGFTTLDPQEAALKTQAMKQCQKTFVLADPSKFDKVLAVTFSDFPDSTLLTTQVSNEKYKKYDNVVEVEAV